MLVCARIGDDANPPVWMCILKPDQFDGHRLLIWDAKVVSAQPDQAVVTANGIPIRAVGAVGALRPDARLQISATFRAPDRIEVDAVRVRPPDWRGWIVNGVSALVLVWLAALLWRHFRLAGSPIGPEDAWPTS
jgi:hypothetical protein